MPRKRLTQLPALPVTATPLLDRYFLLNTCYTRLRLPYSLATFTQLYAVYILSVHPGCSPTVINLIGLLKVNNRWPNYKLLHATLRRFIADGLITMQGDKITLLTAGRVTVLEVENSLGAGFIKYRVKDSGLFPSLPPGKRLP